MVHAFSGALNTVGRYIVNMTRGQEINDEEEQENIPNAILTLTKNVLGQNVTNTIQPLIKRHPHGETKKETTVTPLQQNIEVFQNYQSVPLISATTTTTTTEEPPLLTTQKIEITSVVPLSTNTTTIDSKKKKKTIKKKKNEITKREDAPTTQASKNLDDDDDDEDIQAKKGENYCRTPDGKPGRCEDLSSCPGLLLDLIHLRESLCFKSLFVPGVCCPSPTTVLTTQRPLRLTTRPPVVTTSGNLILKPQKPFVSTTSKPVVTSTISSGDSIFNGDSPNLYDNLVDPEDCGQQEYSTGRIVGGMEAKTGEWPWMAAIFLHGPKRTEFWCGGSLIG
jgi:serine protease 56